MRWLRYEVESESTPIDPVASLGELFPAILDRLETLSIDIAEVQRKFHNVADQIEQQMQSPKQRAKELIAKRSLQPGDLALTEDVAVLELAGHRASQFLISAGRSRWAVYSELRQLGQTFFTDLKAIRTKASELGVGCGQIEEGLVQLGNELSKAITALRDDTLSMHASMFCSSYSAHRRLACRTQSIMVLQQIVDDLLPPNSWVSLERNLCAPGPLMLDWDANGVSDHRIDESWLHPDYDEVRYDWNDPVQRFEAKLEEEERMHRIREREERW
ncbi:MAG: hypothetical protein ACM3ZQ_11745 [Bacillota bacterium]